MMKKSPLTAMTLAALAMAGLTFGEVAASNQHAATDRPDSVRQGHGSHQQHKNAMKSTHGMQETDQALASAYLATLHTFATTLRTQGSRASILDPDFARAAVAEMRRSYDEMQDRHQLFTKSMNDQEKTTREADMKQMRSDHAMIQEHLVALEAQVEKDTLDSKAIMQHTDEILTSCKAMTEMHTAAAGPKKN